MEAISLARQQLYDLVWSEPMISISKRLNIDFDELKKACRQMDVPLPDRGHWSMLKHGKEVLVHPLPADYHGEQNYLFATDAKKEKDRKKAELQILVKKAWLRALDPPDKIIRKAQEKMIDTGTSFYTPTANVAIRVPAKLLKRALKIMDTFLKVLRERGYKLENYKNYYRRDESSYLVIGDNEIEVVLKEDKTRVITERTRDHNYTELKPKGTLCLCFSRYALSIRFNEDKLPLEEQLADIILRVEAVDERLTQERIRNELWRKEQEERSERERLIEEQKRLLAEQKRLAREKEIAEARGLISEARRWKAAQNLRMYIDEVELTSSGDRTDWLSWARAKADWIDPFINGKEGAIKGIDPDGLL